MENRRRAGNDAEKGFVGGLLEVYLIELLKHPESVAAGAAGRDELKARRSSKSGAKRQSRRRD